MFRSQFLSLLAAVLWVALGAAPAAQAQPVARAADLEPMPGEVIVRFKPGASMLRQHALEPRADAAALRQALSGRARVLGQRRGQALEAGDALDERTQLVRRAGADARALARLLAADPEVEFAEPNGRKRRLAAPNDPLYAAVTPGVRPSGPDSGQWYLHAPSASLVSPINIEAAWARTRGSASVVVAVLDTGVRFEHPDLGRVANGGKLLPGYDFVSDSVVAGDGGARDADPSDPGDFVSSADLTADAARPPSERRFKDCELSNSSWHGTSTASLVGAATDNGVGMAGAAPGVQVLPVRVLGKCFGTDLDIQAGMLWAAGVPVGVPVNPTPAKVLNLSLGGAGPCSASYQSVVDQVLAAGAVIVVAAGNSAGGAVGVPGNCRGVITVLALRHAGSKVGFSDLGPEIGIAAPGGNCVNIRAGQPCLYPILAATDSGVQGPVSSDWTNSFNISVGTSLAAPLVAATAGLMFSQQPTLTPAQLRSAMQAAARPFAQSGADNGPDDPTPVAQCAAPRAGVDQLQCYCSSALCGAGMLDAGAAVAAVAGAQARIDVSPAQPVAGAPVLLSASPSVGANGRALVAWSWTLLDGGGIVSGFSSASNAITASLTPSAAGMFSVRLAVTDDLGAGASTTQTVTVAAAPLPPPPPQPTVPSGGGGGAVSMQWLGLLALACVLLRRFRRAAAQSTDR